jgi:predicted acylesterase/phospholipase RssA
MIMKGGITSGVVYPRAACRLAQRYRFRQLGGASAGAIAATFVAAAEHGRARGGFATLYEIPSELGTRLPTLFQPSRGTRAAYALLSTWVEPRWSKARKLMATIGFLIRHAAWQFLVVLGIVLLLAFGVAVRPSTSLGPLAATLLWLLLAMVLALAAAAAAVGLRMWRALPGNGYGLCDGHTRSGRGEDPPITDWMATQLDRLAGLTAGEGPLTFGHLWGSEAVEAFRALADKDEARRRVQPEERRTARELRAVDLEVMTTNVTFERPYRFPFDERIFFFCEERMRTYFPTSVVDHMVQHSSEVPDRLDSDGSPISTLCNCHGRRVRYLPAIPDLPVVMAARISLSFPGLISAVPLHCVDWSRGPGKRTLIEAWFSDGGIASNFPMHLFDSFWPRRPTFGINLQPIHPDFPDQLVWRARSGASGIVPRSHQFSSMGGFLATILDLMENWVDSMQITLPGYRDRIVELRQRDDEGGMNLQMPDATIQALADRGAAAAALLDTFDFDLHRWTRYRVAQSELDGLFEGLAARWEPPSDYRSFLDAYGPTTPRYGFGSQAAAAADREATAELMSVAGDWHQAGHPSSAGDVPRPKPSVRIVPRQ